MDQVNFCYHCGRKVNPAVKSCWFCGSSTERYVRPPKLCPFCHEKVHYLAVKCPHCSEFLDGRNDLSKAAQQQQVILMMEQMNRGGPGGVGGPGLEAPPGLPGGGARAIEAPRQKSLPSSPRLGLPTPKSPGGDRSLPPPPAPRGAAAKPTAEDSFIDVEVSPGRGASSANLSNASTPKSPGASGANLPAVRPQSSPAELLQKALARRGAGDMFAGGQGNLPALRSAGKDLAAAGLPALARLARRIFKRRPKGDGAVEVHGANPEDRYRVCTNCSVEVLASDNFCFQCGQQFRQSPYPTAAPPAPPPGNFLIYLLAFAGMVGALFGEKILAGSHPELLGPVKYGGAFGAAVLTALAFFRKVGFFGRLVGFVIFIASLLVLFVTLS